MDTVPVNPETSTPTAASKVLRTTFPAAVPATGFVRATRELLAPYGFHAANTLPLIATCRAFAPYEIRALYHPEAAAR